MKRGSAGRYEASTYLRFGPISLIMVPAVFTAANNNEAHEHRYVTAATRPLDLLPRRLPGVRAETFAAPYRMER
jgi:hypothetical protein